MLNNVLSALGGYLLLALTAITVQNAVFARALGVSRLLSLVDDTTHTAVFSVLLIVCSTLANVAYYFLNNLYLKDIPSYRYFRPLGIVLCISVVFIVVFVLAVKLFPYRLVGKAAESMPMAAFNSMVIGTILLSSTSNLNLIETVVFSVASALGFTFAVLLVTEGQRKLQNRDMPAAFRGLPSTLLYLGILAMAIYALAGHTFSL